MKKIILVAIMLFSLFGYSQKYEFKKCIIDGNVIKMNGTVNFGDKKIETDTNGQFASYNVEIITDTNDYKEYDVIGLDKLKFEIRIKFSKSVLDKKYDYIITFEVKDIFNNKITSIAYFLNSQKNKFLTKKE